MSDPRIRSIAIVTLIAGAFAGGYLVGRPKPERVSVTSDAALDVAQKPAIVDATTPAAEPDRPPFVPPRIVWSKSGKLVATNELSACGLPGATPCEDKEELVVRDVIANKGFTHAAADIFGFRADEEWLVIRARGSKDLVEWNPGTDETRPSAFADRTRDAKGLCLSPDDEHLVVVGEYSAQVRRRGGADVVEVADLTYARVPPTSCAFSPDGKRFAFAGEKHVAIYELSAKDDEIAAQGGLRPLQAIPVPSAGRIGWSAATLSFLVDEDIDGLYSLLYTWSPKGALTVTAVSGPTRPQPHRSELLTRWQCEWDRVGFDGRTIARGKAPETCFHVRHHDIVVSPAGNLVASAEGEWGGSHLVIDPVP